eukprot:TRINITY_DN11121_c0_g2_i1.p1 TRINITY_DN11121_c0_g2~~TRINITY_DN11121_c0_g2_i1.p1  ORF type:complete len:330 (-),score=36.58 TRINITY_DN11121_c0_g2_i1:321-1310(-)
MTFRLRNTLRDANGEIFCVRYAPDPGTLGICSHEGVFKAYNVRTGRESTKFHCRPPKERQAPCMSFRFSPRTGGEATVLTGCSDGTVAIRALPSAKRIGVVGEAPNEVLAVEFSPEGSHFVTAGRDYKLRLYDTEEMVVSNELSAGEGRAAGHCNRVFALKWSKQEPNLLLSGGWDRTVQVWDLRVNRAVRSIFGPFISGDGLDVLGNTVVTGSCREKDQIELWDLGTCQKVSAIPWPQTDPPSPTMIYTVRLSPNGRYVAAGGSGTAEAHVFDVVSGKSLGGLRALKKPIYSTDFASNEQLAFAGADGYVYILHVARTDERPVKTPKT